ncbi:hypothetical protein [Xenorhabdus nematophila]|nr:hypothetical protein [Xenorhabdus nematophila]
MQLNSCRLLSGRRKKTRRRLLQTVRYHPAARHSVRSGLSSAAGAVAG